MLLGKERKVLKMDIINMIQSVGVPVAFCIAMGYYVKHISDQHREDVNKLNEQHKEEMAEVTQALNNNTIALQKLTDYLVYNGGMKE